MTDKRNIIIADLAAFAAEVLTTHAAAPEVRITDVDDVPQPTVAMQLWETGSVAARLAALTEWADRLTAPVRIRDRGEFIKLAVVFEAVTSGGCLAQLEVWSHLRPSEGHELMGAAGAEAGQLVLEVSAAALRRAAIKVEQLAVAA